MGRIPRGSRGVGDPEVATRLDPGERYRIWWFNRRRVVRTQVFENGENGRRYRKRSTTAYQPREEWIAVPVPDYGIICGLAPEVRPDPLYRAPDIYHASPYDTYYCITVGVWNPLLERTRFFERVERLLRSFTPGTDPRLCVER